MNKGTLDSFGLWCPFCGKNTIRKTISSCKFILCDNFIKCDYFKIIEYGPIDIDNKDDNKSNNANNNEKNEEYMKNHCVKKLKQFIHDERRLEKNKENERNLKDNEYNKTPYNQHKPSIRKGSKKTLKDNELEICKNEEKNDINLIMNILNENKREKSKIELFREESRWKKAINNQRRTVKQRNIRREKFKKEKERQRKKEEELKKEAFKKEKLILKTFKEKYEKLFDGEGLSLENITTAHFKKEEIEVGLKEYEKEQLLIEKETKAKKEKERIEELKKMRRRLER